MNDLISSYPVIPQPGCRQQFNEQPYANSMAIRLIPSMYQMKKKIIIIIIIIINMKSLINI